jgi:hypothetical protein
VEWDVSQKIISKEKNETKRCVFGHPITHGDVREGQVPILFVPSEANLLRSFFAYMNHPFYKAINLGMIS